MNYELDSAVRSYHYYRRYWSPQENEILKCYHKTGNPFDIFAIKTCSNQDPCSMDNLPQEINRITKYLLERDTEIEAQLTSTLYRRSPRTQGGLEIPCKVIIRMPGYWIDTHN